MPPPDFAPRFTDGDAFYEALVERLDALDEEQAQAFLCRLVLILANQIGDTETLGEALKAAGGKP